MFTKTHLWFNVLTPRIDYWVQLLGGSSTSAWYENLRYRGRCPSRTTPGFLVGELTARSGEICSHEILGSRSLCGWHFTCSHKKNVTEHLLTHCLTAVTFCKVTAIRLLRRKTVYVYLHVLILASNGHLPVQYETLCFRTYDSTLLNMTAQSCVWADGQLNLPLPFFVA